jgi:hypothetical protein
LKGNLALVHGQMSSRSISVILAVFFVLTLFCSGLAWGTSASITVTGNEGPIPLDASATFTSYKHCDSENPPNCWYVDSGRLEVYRDSSLIASVSGSSYVSWSNTLDGGAMSQGDHTFSATAVDSEGVSYTDSTVITIDNTPIVSVNSPNLVEGAFDITGSATFKERVGGNEGTIYLYIDRIDKPKGSKSYEGTTVTWSYSEITGYLLDAGVYTNGDHKIYVQAKAANGASEWAEGIFIINNTPIVSVNSLGQVEGEFDFSGSATFKEHVGGNEGTIYLYIDRTDKYGFKGSLMQVHLRTVNIRFMSRLGPTMAPPCGPQRHLKLWTS